MSPASVRRVLLWTRDFAPPFEPVSMMTWIGVTAPGPTWSRTRLRALADCIPWGMAVSEPGVSSSPKASDDTKASTKSDSTSTRAGRRVTPRPILAQVPSLGARRAMSPRSTHGAKDRLFELHGLRHFGAKTVHDQQRIVNRQGETDEFDDVGYVEHHGDPMREQEDDAERARGGGRRDEVGDDQGPTEAEHRDE